MFRQLSVPAPVFAIGLVLVEASGFINGCVVCCLDQKMFCSCRNLAEIWGGDLYISTVTIWTTFWDIWKKKSKRLFIAVVHVQIQKYKMWWYQRLLQYLSITEQRSARRKYFIPTWLLFFFFYQLDLINLTNLTSSSSLLLVSAML